MFPHQNNKTTKQMTFYLSGWGWRILGIQQKPRCNSTGIHSWHTHVCLSWLHLLAYHTLNSSSECCEQITKIERSVVHRFQCTGQRQETYEPHSGLNLATFTSLQNSSIQCGQSVIATTNQEWCKRASELTLYQSETNTVTCQTFRLL